MESSRRALAFGSVKTRFKAIFKKLEFSAQIYFFMNFCLRRATGDFSVQIYFFNELLPPEGDFSAQVYFFHELLPPEGD